MEHSNDSYCIVVRRDDNKIVHLAKCVDGQVTNASTEKYYPKKMGTEEEVATFALDKGCDMTEFQERLDEANNPDELV